MTLSTNAKDYIASNLGRNNCFASSGIAYTDPRGDSHTGSTYNVVKTMKLGGTGPHGEWFDDIPDYRQITDADIAWIGSNSYCVGEPTPTPTPTPTPDCTPGDKRCYGGNIQTCHDEVGWENTTICPNGCETVGGVPRCKDAPTGCIPGTRRCNGDRVEECNTNREWVYVRTCAYGCSGAGICNAAPAPPTPGEQPVTGPFEVWVGGGISCPAGAPTVTLDTTDAFAYFKATPAIYVGVMNIMVHHIHDDCYAYFAWEMRMWDEAAGATCPTEDPEWQEISRFLAKVSPKKVITLKRVDAGATEMVSGSFEIPSHFKGRKTICLSLWGNYSYDALVAELAAAGYEKEIDW